MNEKKYARPPFRLPPQTMLPSIVVAALVSTAAVVLMFPVGACGDEVASESSLRFADGTLSGWAVVEGEKTWIVADAPPIAQGNPEHLRNVNSLTRSGDFEEETNLRKIPRRKRTGVDGVETALNCRGKFPSSQATRLTPKTGNKPFGKLRVTKQTMYNPHLVSKEMQK